MKQEKQCWKKLKSAVFKHYKDRVDRVESNVTSGMPDVNYCIDGKEGWIELKAPTEPKRAESKLFGSNHKLLQTQLNWILRQVKAGGRCFVFIATDKHYIMMHGKDADMINDATVQQLKKKSVWWYEKPCPNDQWIFLRRLISK